MESEITIHTNYTTKSIYITVKLIKKHYNEGWHLKPVAGVILTCQLSQLLGPFVLGGDDTDLMTQNTCC